MTEPDKSAPAPATPSGGNSQPSSTAASISKKKSSRKRSPTKQKSPTKGSGDPPTSASRKKRPRVAESSKKTSQKAAVATPPTRVLVIDNGGHAIKYGWNTDAAPRSLPNQTARLPQQWTVLAGDVTTQVQNPLQLTTWQRSSERGCIVNLGNQVQVWKRLLDLSGVAVPLHTETARAMGWAATQKKKQDALAAKPKATILPQHCAVVLTVLPHCPRGILDQIQQIWCHDFGFGHVGLVTAPLVAALPDANLETSCVVDLGWSAIHILPTFQGRPIRNGKEDICLRRIPMAGRHLIQLYKYACSYRQWNLMNQGDWILEQVLEDTAYLSLEWDRDLKVARDVPAGRRPYDLEFVLPNEQNKFRGETQVPLALQKQQSMEEGSDEEEDDEDDEDVDENEMEADENEEEDAQGGSSGDSDSEDDMKRRQILLKQRREEERRRRLEQEQEQQVLMLSVERFTIPEALFRPSDAGLLPEQAGLAQGIVQAIQSCPPPFPPALFRSIHLVGGLSQLPNLKERLQRELCALAPCEYEVNVSSSDAPVDQAWKGACHLTKEESYERWSVSREEWEASSQRGAWKCLLVSQGGKLI